MRCRLTNICTSSRPPTSMLSYVSVSYSIPSPATLSSSSDQWSSISTETLIQQLHSMNDLQCSLNNVSAQFSFVFAFLWMILRRAETDDDDDDDEISMDLSTNSSSWLDSVDRIIFADLAWDFCENMFRQFCRLKSICKFKSSVVKIKTHIIARCS